MTDKISLSSWGAERNPKLLPELYGVFLSEQQKRLRKKKMKKLNTNANNYQVSMKVFINVGPKLHSSI